MRRARRDPSPAPEPLRTAVFALAGLDAALLLLALRMGAEEVRDGAGSITTGYNVATSVAVVLALALALRWAPGPAPLRARTQAYALLAVAAHATGHLTRLYYVVPWYDDVLHVGLVVPACVLAVRHAQALDLFPARHATPPRAALLALVCAMAFAGAWEVFEFTMDSIQGTREQDDLADTMRDMIDGLGGGLLGAAWCFRHPAPPRVRGASARGGRDPRRG